MNKLKLVDENDPILTTPCKEYDFDNQPFEPIQYARDLVETMYSVGSFGLSSNQVGNEYKVIALRGSPENIVAYNPKIVWESDAKILLEEKSFTSPGILVKIKRSQHIRVRYNMPNGELVTKKYTGMTARIFQQQMDYLNGEIFYNKANYFHKKQALKKRKK
jgi:peptide deformylase